jgi:hypothetical protein
MGMMMTPAKEKKWLPPFQPPVVRCQGSSNENPRDHFFADQIRISFQSPEHFDEVPVVSPAPEGFTVFRHRW